MGEIRGELPLAHEAMPNLSRDEMRLVVDAYQSGGRIPMEMGDRFANANLQNGGFGLTVADAGVAVGLFGAHVSAETFVESHRGRLPTFGTLPNGVSRWANNVYELYPIGSENVPSRQVVEHFPQVALGAAIGYTTFQVGSRLINYTRQRGFARRAATAQERFRGDYAEGMVNWEIPEGATIAFVGGGDPLAQELARDPDHDIMQISYEPVPGAWTAIPRQSGREREQVYMALDRADIGHADELMIFPIVPTHEFLPGPDDHDIRIDQATEYILAADEMREDAGMPLLPVTIIGDGQQYEVYVDTLGHSSRNALERRVTLKERAQQLTHDRGEEVRILDTTKIIIDRIREVAGGIPVQIAGSGPSMDVYRERFYEAYGPQHPAAESDWIAVRYGRTDLTTVATVKPDDIAVVLDPGQKRSLINRRHNPMPEDRVLVPAEEVLRVLGS